MTDHLKEYLGIKTQGDQIIDGVFIKDGTEIFTKTVAQFEGYKCQIWAPEFHSIMIDSSIHFAKEAELIRRSLAYIHNSDIGCTAILDDEDNIGKSFRAIQLALTSIILSVSAVESWVNKTIHAEVTGDLTFFRLDGRSVTWCANRIESDSSLGEKIFCVLPAKLGFDYPLTATTRKRFVEIIQDRNTLAHLKNSPKINGNKVKRLDLSLKLLRRNSLFIPKNTISMIKAIYDLSSRTYPIWLTGNIGSLEAAEKSSKSKK